MSPSAVSHFHYPVHSSVPFTRDDLIAKAKQLNLDVARFTRDLDTHRFKPPVDADRQEGNRLGVDCTSFLFINGHAISGAVPDSPPAKNLRKRARSVTRA